MSRWMARLSPCEHAEIYHASRRVDAVLVRCVWRLSASSAWKIQQKKAEICRAHPPCAAGLVRLAGQHAEVHRRQPKHAVFRRRAGKQAVGFGGAEGNQSPARGKSTSWAYCRNITEAASGSGCLRRFGRRQSREAIGCCRSKTVQTGHYEEYDRTNAFYQRMGFLPLECLPTLWDEWNPCQVYVLPLQNS